MYGCPETDLVEPAGDRGVPCERTEPLGLVEPCRFGPDAGEPFVLLGDSHANALRSAFAQLGRPGYAVTRNGCPFVRDGRPLPEPDFGECATWKRQVPRWLVRHPEIRTAYVIGLPRNAANQDPANWEAAFKTLPVRVVVIRDTPELREDTLACVERTPRRPGSACAVPRAEALAPDPATRTGRETVDLTSLFCDETRCFPVIGGVLAYLDRTHVSPAFAETVGPFLGERLRRLG